MFSSSSSVADASLPRYLHHTVREQLLPESKEVLLDIDVERDGNCMYYAVVMAYLLSADNEPMFAQYFQELFYKQKDEVITNFYERVQRYRGELEIFEDLYFDEFVNYYLRDKLNKYMQANNLTKIDDYSLCDEVTKVDSWGDSVVLIGLSGMLNVHIEIYVFNKENKLEKFNFEVGTGNKKTIRLIHQGVHFHYLLEPALINAIIPKGNEPNLIAALREIGKHKSSDKRETAIMEEFANYSRLNTTLANIKRFVFDHYYTLPDFDSPLAKRIEKYSDYFLRVNFAKNPSYLMNDIKVENLVAIGIRYLSSAPSRFFSLANEIPAAYLLAMQDPITGENWTHPSSPTQLWYFLLHIYATLSSPSEKLAVDIQRLVSRIFNVRFQTNAYFPSCKKIAMEVVKRISSDEERGDIEAMKIHNMPSKLKKLNDASANIRKELQIKLG